MTKLHLIGPDEKKFAPRSERLISKYPRPDVVVRHGQLGAPEVSRILSRAQFALTNVNSQNWSKSGAFMACAAHGCAVVAKVRANMEPTSLTILPEEVGTISDAAIAEKIARLSAEFKESGVPAKASEKPA